MKTRYAPAKKIHTPKAQDSAQMFEEGAIKALRTAGFRITMPRVQVIRALADTKTALSAYKIHEKIIDGQGKIDVVSVYRILTTLQEVGLIYHVGVVDGYFPCRLPSGTQRSLVVVDEATEHIVEVELPIAVIEEIQRQGENSGFEVSTIKVEVVGSKNR
jgi:Fe2+ or Zn2+ uptake regulation protein